LPGLLKVGLRKVPARRAGTLIGNSATAEMIAAAAKPAGVGVRISAVSKLNRRQVRRASADART
jgi:hypothetical protein